MSSEIDSVLALVTSVKPVFRKQTGMNPSIINLDGSIILIIFVFLNLYTRQLNITLQVLLF